MSTKPSFYKGFFEPESAANTDYQPEYRYNNITQTPRGHSFEMDDTPTRERVRLSHRSGTFIEMHPNGDEVHKVFGDGYEITIKDKNVLIKGSCNIVIEGDCNMHVQGDKIETIDGNLEQHVKGNFTQVVDKTTSITSQGDMEITAGVSALGTLQISTGDHMSISGDLSVKGEIVGDKIASITRVDAGTGVSAGPLGFVTMLGGLSVGIPVAVPQQILCSTNISAGTFVNAAVSVNAPTGNFGLMSAMLMTDKVNTNLYNIHTHIGNLGYPTSPSLTKMV
jgi:hypothetical protein